MLVAEGAVVSEGMTLGTDSILGAGLVCRATLVGARDSGPMLTAVTRNRFPTGVAPGHGGAEGCGAAG